MKRSSLHEKSFRPVARLAVPFSVKLDLNLVTWVDHSWSARGPSGGDVHIRSRGNARGSAWGP